MPRSSFDKEELQKAILAALDEDNKLPAGMTKKIAQRFGCSEGIVRYYRRRHGISAHYGRPRRRSSRARDVARYQALVRKGDASEDQIRHAREKIAPTAHLSSQRAMRAGGLRQLQIELATLERQASQSREMKAKLRHKLRHARNRVAAALEAERKLTPEQRRITQRLAQLERRKLASPMLPQSGKRALNHEIDQLRRKLREAVSAA